MLKYFLLIYFLLLVCSVNGQGIIHRVISDVDGLASNTIYSIVQHTDGYLWLGTANGLVRYDGQHFQTLKSEELKDHEILSIEEDQYGNVWGINLAGQLFSVDKSFDKIQLKSGNGLPRFAHFTLYQKKQLLGVAKKGESKKRIVDVFIIDLMANTNTHKKIKHQLIANNKITRLKDILMIDDDVFEIEENGKVLNKTDRILDHKNLLLISEKDSIFLNKGKLNWSSDGYVKLKNISLPPNSRINTTFIDGKYLLLGTKDGLLIYSENGELINGQFFFANMAINVIEKDREGNILMGTANNGLITFKNYFLEHWTRQNSILGSDLIHKIYHKDSTLYLIQSDGHISTYSKNGKTNTLKTNMYGVVSDIAEFSPGKFLMQADFLHVYDVNVNKATVLLKNSNLKKILCKDEHLYVSSHQGVFKFDRPKIHTEFNFNMTNRIFRNRSYDLLFDSKGVLWIASTEGLYTFVRDSISKFPLEGSISSLSLDSIGKIYIGTNNKGVYVINENRIIDTINIKSKLPSNTIKKIFQAAGSTWIMTNKSLSRIKGKYLVNYDSNDGMPTNEINDAAIFDNKIWIGTRSGVATFPLNYDPLNETRPIVYINSVKSRGIALSDQELDNINHDQNDISFYFNGINFTNKNKIKYSYQLEGYEMERQLTSENMVTYPSLPPSQYYFSVTAINEDGVASETKGVSFSIIPPIYLRWWFYPLLSIIFIGSIFSIWYIQAKRKEKELSLNNQLITLQQQSLQTQMNPHFIFNSMNTIQQYITSNDKKAAITYLSRFARLIRLIFEYSKHDKIDVDDEIAFLELYIPLEQLRFDGKITVDFKIEDSIYQRKEDVRIPPLLIQPLLENAFKHGLFHKEDKGLLSINLDYQDPLLICTIEDDGVGRQQIKELGNWRSKEYQSSGIETIAKRLNLLKRTEGSTENLIQIIDLKDDAGIPRGTKIILKIPTV